MTQPVPCSWLELALRTTVVSVLALIIAVSSASAGSVFDSEQCVELVSKEAQIVAVIPPGSSDNNDATTFPVEDMPAIEPGDLVRVKPAQGEAAPLPTFSLIERRADRCKQFRPGSAGVNQREK